jgi:hypothetical protein
MTMPILPKPVHLEEAIAEFGMKDLPVNDFAKFVDCTNLKDIYC